MSLFQGLMQGFNNLANSLNQFVQSTAGWVSNAVNQMTNAVVQNAAQFASSISQGFGQFTQSLLTGFGQYTNFLGNALAGALSQVGQLLGASTGQLGNWLASIGSQLGESIWGSISQLSNLLTQSVMFLGNVIASLRDATAGALTNIYASIIAGVSRFGDLLIQGANFMTSTLGGILEAGFGSVASTLGLLPQSILNVGDALARSITYLAGGMSGILEELSKIADTVVAARGFAPRIPEAIWSYVRRFLEQMWNGLVQAGKSMREAFLMLKEAYFEYAIGISLVYLNQFIIRPLLATFRAIRGEGSGLWFVDQFVRSITNYTASEIVSTLRYLLEEDTQPRGEYAWEVTKRFVAYCYMFSVVGAIGLFIERILWSILHFHVFGTGLGGGGGGGGGEIHTLVMGLYYSTGLGWLSWAAFGPLVRYTIADPLREYFAYKYRPERFTRSELQRLLRKRIISEETFKEDLAYQGYSDERIKAFLEDAWDDLSLSYIYDLYEEGVIPFEEMLERIKRLGYKDEDAYLLALLGQLRATRDERYKIITRLAKWYARGYIDYDTAFRYITSLGMPEDQARILLDAWELDFRLEVIDEIIDSIIDAFRKDLITEDEFRERLAQYIVRPEMLEAIYEREMIRKMPKITPLTFYRLQRYLRTLEERLQKVESQIKYYRERLEEREQLCISRRNVIIARYDRRIREIQVAYAKKEEKLHEEYEMRIRIFDDILKAVWDQPPEVIDKYIEDLSRRIPIVPKEMAKIYRWVIDFLRTIRDLPPEERKRLWEEEKKKIQEMYESELQKLHQEMEARIKELEKERDAKLQEVAKKCEEELKTLRHRLEQLEALKVALEEEIEAYKQAIAQYLARRRTS